MRERHSGKRFLETGVTFRCANLLGCLKLFAKSPVHTYLSPFAANLQVWYDLQT